MSEKCLGKITSAEYGMHKDYPYLFGVQLGFKIGDRKAACGGRYTVNMHPDCKYENKTQKQYVITRTVEELYQILQDAKVSYVSELVGTPVEVEIDDKLFKSFRVLTEVL